MRVKFQTDADLDGRVIRGLRRAMPLHFSRYVAGAKSPGVILLRKATPIASAIEELALIWSASEGAEWIDRLVWIPL